MSVGQALAIHQFHDSVAPSDAVSDHLFFIQRAMKDIGVGGSIFSRHIRGLENQVHPFKKEKVWDCDLLLVHYSMGIEAPKEIFELEIPKALVYHNITPPEFFPHDSFLKSLALQGRRQLKKYAGEFREAYCDSDFNGMELKALGYRRVTKLPLFDLALREKKFSASKPGKNNQDFLFVGRLAPHKQQALLIKIFYHLLPKIDSHSRLILVGAGDPIYTHYLRLLITQLGLGERVLLVGKVSATELRRYYATARAFLSVSEHEGFGIPLVESMQADLPVLFRPRAAVTETMGEGGYCLKGETPEELATEILGVLEDSVCVARVIQKQRERLLEFGKFQTTEKVQSILGEALSEIRKERPLERCLTPS